MQQEAVVKASGMGTSPGGVAMGAARFAAMGVSVWMRECRDWLVVLPGEPCPAGLEYNMHLDVGINRARLPANLRARLDAVQAAGRAAA